MSKNLYIAATESSSGKSIVALGIMEMLCSNLSKVGFFRPIINQVQRGEKDKDIELIATQFKLTASYEEMSCFTFEQVQELVSKGKKDFVVEKIIEKYNRMKDLYDFIVLEGTDYNTSTAAYEFDINAEISKNLGCPVLLVSNAFQKNAEQIIYSTKLAMESLNLKGCEIIGTIINRIDPSNSTTTIHHLQNSSLAQGQIICTIPEDPYLGWPTIQQVADHLHAKVLLGESSLNRHVSHFTVAAMQLRNFLLRIKDRSLIITPGDRADVIVACCVSMISRNYEKIAGIVLTGGLEPEDSVWDLIKGFPEMVPVLSVKEDTFAIAAAVNAMRVDIDPHDTKKVNHVLALFEKNIPVDLLRERIISVQTDIVTPKKFEYELIQKARSKKRHIVLAEGEEERILTAAELLLQREAVDLTLLGNEQVIQDKINRLGLNIKKIQIINPLVSPLYNEFAEMYYELKKHKGLTKEKALDALTDPSYFATMMVYKGLADGMVSGAIHSTANTVRPALEIIKTVPDCSIVSSVFFMCFHDRVLVYGDCAVNPDPNAQQLAEIAISSALTARAFGIEPRVAMLSYSSGDSGKGAHVDKVREATILAKEISSRRGLDIMIDGPMQYDTAVDPLTARTKMPKSKVSGRATVFIFPDLNTGNNTYKAVQRSAGIVAIGPVLQGLKKPVNDLSRGCTVADIFTTVLITAIQSQTN
ncbi:MAG: phosphate acetyltransferase [Candidatus Omnitrophica bacterium]|nr:phosphate acetyltransferase [Candidatus Omnitrophota bacterium]